MIFCILILATNQGRYIPTYASEIYDQNAKLESLDIAPINLSSIMIGLPIRNLYTSCLFRS